MNKIRWIRFSFVTSLVALGSVIGTAGSSCLAQPTAIIDIRAVFQQHEAFNQQLDLLRKQAEQFQAEAQQAEQRLIQQSESLRQYAPSSQEFRNGESQLAQQAAVLEVSQRNKMQEMMRAEARLHFDAYQQVRAVVTEQCEQRGVNLVLRFRNDPMDPQNAESVMQRVNSSVVFFRSDLDLTASVVAAIRQRSAETVSRSSSTLGTVPR